EIPGRLDAAVLGGRRAELAIQAAGGTEALIPGAEGGAARGREHGVRRVQLMARSHGWGDHEANDGSVSDRRVPGEGVAAAALRRQGVQVFNETELAQLEQLLQQQVQSCDEPSGTKR